MSEYGQAIAPDTFQITRTLPGPIERLWQYIVDGEKRKQWFAGGAMEQRPGGTIHFWFEHKNLAPAGEPVPEKFKQPNEGMAAPGKVLRIEPPRLLVFEWGGGEVVFELSPVGNEVRFTITHRKLASREDVVNVANGWHKHLDVLAAHLAGQPRQPFWSRLAELEQEYEKQIPADGSWPQAVVKHRYNAPAERVFDAFLDPAKAGNFLFATPAGQMVRVEIDPRVGGKFNFTDRRDGQDIEHVGEYLEIDRPRRLVFTFAAIQFEPTPMRVEIDIASVDGGCELTLTHTMSPKWAAFKTKSAEGWGKILAGLEAVL
jgi:uncharacterized protein YndB with AHSA1/START domain